MNLKAYAAVTHQGPMLELNEDAYDFDLDQELFFILDGLGGVGVGDKAAEKIRFDVKDLLTKISRDPEATMPFYFNPRYLVEGNALVNALIQAHQNLFKLNGQRRLQTRAGASGVFALKAGHILMVASVGNCQAFCLRNGHLSKLFIEDSFQFLSGDDFRHHRLSAPIGAFGFFPELSYQLKEIRLSEGDTLIFLTDGIHQHVEEEEIRFTTTRPELSSQEILNNLVKLSNARGNLDNQTGMILKF